MLWFYYTIDRTIEQVFFLFLCNSSPTCRGELLLYYVKITLISSFVNMSVRVIFAAILVFHFSLQIEALPFFLSCRMDWNTCGGNTVAFEEILICKLANYKFDMGVKT